MKELARIVFIESEEGLQVECCGAVLDMMPALTMGAADVICSVAPKLGMTEDEAVKAFCSAFRCAVGLRRETNRVDVSAVARLLRKMGKEPPKQD